MNTACNRPYRCLPALFFLCLIAAAYLAGRASAEEPKADRLFELRIYTAGEGKMDAMHARFRDHTCKLFEKHGMDLIGFWVPNTGDDAGKKLYYILAYPDKEARDKSWQAFMRDPDWIAAYRASEADGRLAVKVESVFMSPADYSKIK